LRQEREKAHYNPPEARAYFRPSAASYLLIFVKFERDEAERLKEWFDFTDVIKKGKTR